MEKKSIAPITVLCVLSLKRHYVSDYVIVITRRSNLLLAQLQGANCLCISNRKQDMSMSNDLQMLPPDWFSWGHSPLCSSFPQPKSSLLSLIWVGVLQPHKNTFSQHQKRSVSKTNVHCLSLLKHKQRWHPFSLQQSQDLQHGILEQSCPAVQIEHLCHMRGHFIVYEKILKEGESGSASSQPPTGALCIKCWLQEALFPYYQGDSINQISQRALQHRTWQQAHRGGEWERERERRQRKGHWERDNSLRMRQEEGKTARGYEERDTG